MKERLWLLYLKQGLKIFDGHCVLKQHGNMYPIPAISLIEIVEGEDAHEMSEPDYVRNVLIPRVLDGIARDWFVRNSGWKKRRFSVPRHLQRDWSMMTDLLLKTNSHLPLIVEDDIHF